MLRIGHGQAQGLGVVAVRGGGFGRGSFGVFGFPGAFSFPGFRFGNPFAINWPFPVSWPSTWYPYYPTAYAAQPCPIGTINLNAEQTRTLQAGAALVISTPDTCGNLVQVTLHGTPGAGLTVGVGALAGDCCCR